MSNISKALRHTTVAAMLVVGLGTNAAVADPLGFAAPSIPFGTIFEQVLRDRGSLDGSGTLAPPSSLRQQSVARPAQEDADEAADLAPNLRRQVVNIRPARRPAPS